jgi:hypothetical protein
MYRKFEIWLVTQERSCSLLGTTDKNRPISVLFMEHACLHVMVWVTLMHGWSGTATFWNIGVVHVATKQVGLMKVCGKCSVSCDTEESWVKQVLKVGKLQTSSVFIVVFCTEFPWKGSVARSIAWTSHQSKSSLVLIWIFYFSLCGCCFRPV